MTTELRLQPMAPSVRRTLAEFLMVHDPRCAHELALATSRVQCSICFRNLDNYLDVVPQEWPA